MMTKQKKEYLAPKSKIVQLRHQAHLMEDSCNGDYCGDLGQRHDTPTENNI